MKKIYIYHLPGDKRVHDRTIAFETLEEAVKIAPFFAQSGTTLMHPVEVMHVYESLSDYEASNGIKFLERLDK